jgi:hypothetical protein
VWDSVSATALDPESGNGEKGHMRPMTHPATDFHMLIKPPDKSGEGDMSGAGEHVLVRGGYRDGWKAFLTPTTTQPRHTIGHSQWTQPRSRPLWGYDDRFVVYIFMAALQLLEKHNLKARRANKRFYLVD